MTGFSLRALVTCSSLEEFTRPPADRKLCLKMSTLKERILGIAKPCVHVEQVGKQSMLEKIDAAANQHNLN
jgi:hypothetical protein